MTDVLPVVRGFRFAAGACGIKPGDRPDLAILVADERASAAGVFTKNRVVAAPVVVARERVRRGRASAVLVNAGNANACTGKAGLVAARKSSAALARALGVDEGAILPASTGVIGVPLPHAKITAAIPRLVAELDVGAASFAKAIMTTDRWPKTASATFGLGAGASGRSRATILGIAKGAGMIHPNMATTLAFVVTDASVRPAELRRALAAATASSFNGASVDGDTSTNDTILALASGHAGEPSSPKLASALSEVLGELARSIVRDGEGAEHVVTFDVRGLASDRAAGAVARTIATSLLVKTALHGCDPNWGRILAAAGRADVAFDPDVAELRFEDVVVVRRGVVVSADAERDARAIMKRPEYTIRVTLGRGRGRARYVTCDLGYEYVRINASYRS